MKHRVKIITIFLIMILFFSTISFAIYRALTIGDRSLTFTLNLGDGSGENPGTTVNLPNVVVGMIPVKYNGTDWVITNQNDSNWYSYTENNNLWANVMLSDGRYKANGTNIVDSSNNNSIVTTNGTQTVAKADLGSMFVWIPRYEYKITYTNSTDVTKGGTIDVNFISTATTVASTDYTIHPAFRNGTNSSFSNGEWDNEIDGFWMAKFQASNSTGNYVSTTGYIRSIPGVAAWSNVQISKAFTYCMDMNTTQALAYGITSNTLDTHLTKNSEWGAVAYLAYSSFGRNGVQPNINNYMPTVHPRVISTGHGGESPIATKITSNPVQYNSANGLLASTTGNATGVYDMNGALNEHVAAFVGTNTLIYETTQETYSTSTKYTNRYEGISMITYGKTGDATRETRGWNANNSTTIQNYFFRGGAPSNGGNSGLFSFYASDGAGGTGKASPDFRGFRPVLIAK